MKKNKYVLWLGVLLIGVSTLALGVSIQKGSSDTFERVVDIHNVIPVPQINYTSFSGNGTVTVGTTVNFDVGSAKLDGSTVISGRLKMDIDMMMTDYDSQAITLDIILASNIITFVNQASPTDTIVGGISLSDNTTETPAIGSGVTSKEFTPTNPTGNHGTVTAYLYFVTPTLVPGGSPQGYYRSNPVGMTIQYH